MMGWLPRTLPLKEAERRELEVLAEKNMCFEVSIYVRGLGFPEELWGERLELLEVKEDGSVWGFYKVKVAPEALEERENALDEAVEEVAEPLRSAGYEVEVLQVGYDKALVGFKFKGDEELKVYEEDGEEEDMVFGGPAGI